MIAVFAFSFIGLLCISAPITVALGGWAMAYALISGNVPITTLIQTTFGGLATFPLLAIPLFMLAGNLMNEGGITPDLVRFARLLLGHINGGLGLATILACAIFSAISGAAVATAVAIGVVMIPAMKEAGYDEDVGAAMTSVASCMGPIIPPSIPFIIYGVAANVSVGALFLGGVFPGLLLGLSLMVYMYYVARKRNYPIDPKTPTREILIAAWKAIPALFMPVLIMGGILSGMFTPTEAAGVTVVYAVLVGVFVYRKLTWSSLPKVLLQAGLESGMVMLLIALSEPFSWIVAADQIPQILIEWISHADHVALHDPAAHQHLPAAARDPDGNRAGHRHRDPGLGADCGHHGHRPGAHRRRHLPEPRPGADHAAGGRGALCGLRHRQHHPRPPGQGHLDAVFRISDRAGHRDLCALAEHLAAENAPGILSQRLSMPAANS